MKNCTVGISKRQIFNTISLHSTLVEAITDTMNLGKNAPELHSSAELNIDKSPNLYGGWYVFSRKLPLSCNYDHVL